MAVRADAAPNTKLKHGRSKATNHRDLLPHVADGRLSQARRFRDLVRALIADAGGVELCSEAKLGLIRRLAAATVMSEELEARAVNGEHISVSEFCTLASTTVRIASRLGLTRTARPVETLSEYLARLPAEQQAVP
jgi:hypothetical protein